MKAIYDDIPCVYFSSSIDGIMTEANASLCGLLSYTRDELVGRKLETIFSLASRIFQQTHFYPLLQLKGHAEEIYLTLKAKGGEDVPVLINAERKQKNGRTQLHFAGIAVDKRKRFEEEIIAAKKAAEKALEENTALKTAQEQLQQRAEELDRQFVLVNLQNQELRQLNHLATHTLQEPLRKLLFFSSEILKTDDEKRSKSATQKIRKTAEDMQAKLQGLQKYAWLTGDGMKWEAVNLAGILESAKTEIETENPGISVILTAEEIPVIEADNEQMQSLLKELLSNAVRFRKQGNTVQVNLYASTLLLNEFRQLSEKYKYAEFLKLQIQDNGISFDDRYQDQAFELFRTLHPESGLGLGLSLCKKIVDNHGGSISLESEKNEGTTATIFLPLKRKITSL